MVECSATLLRIIKNITTFNNRKLYRNIIPLTFIQISQKTIYYTNVKPEHGH